MGIDHCGVAASAAVYSAECDDVAVAPVVDAAAAAVVPDTTGDDDDDDCVVSPSPQDNCFANCNEYAHPESKGS